MEKIHLRSEKLKYGTKVRVKKCTSIKGHGDNIKGCVCSLIGKMVTIATRHWADSDSPPSYQLVGHVKRVRRSEVIVLRKQK